MRARLVVALILLPLVTAGCGIPGFAGGGAGAAPIWAAQLAWSPSPMSLAVQYNSSDPSAPSDGAYASTPSALPLAGWQTQTWKLTGVHWDGGQNFGADLRISGSVGVAVQKVALSLQAPGTGGPTASIDLGSDTGQGLRQVGAGRNQLRKVDGQSAEVLDSGKSANTVSAIYLQLSPDSPVLTVDPTVVYATVTFTAVNATQPWSVATFAQMAAKGIHRAEINMEWAAVEPAPGHFDFSVLDGDLSNAAKAGVKVIPIFWYSVWRGNPAPWITEYDVGSDGAVSAVPAWWSSVNQQAYFTYVKDTVAHIKKSPGFGGAFLDYGWLDYMWGPAPGGSGVNGYAPADVATYHQWLPTRYGSLTAFNRQYRTSYTAWDQVPAAKPGQALFAVYQQFRDWSVSQTYSQLSAIYRKETAAPLYYYWGGGFDGFGTAFNLPDTFFAVAEKYHGTVVLDDANNTGLAIAFNSLARAYGVPLMEEWTPLHATMD